MGSAGCLESVTGSSWTAAGPAATGSNAGLQPGLRAVCRTPQLACSASVCSYGGGGRYGGGGGGWGDGGGGRCVAGSQAAVAVLAGWAAMLHCTLHAQPATQFAAWLRSRNHAAACSTLATATGQRALYARGRSLFFSCVLRHACAARLGGRGPGLHSSGALRLPAPPTFSLNNLFHTRLLHAAATGVATATVATAAAGALAAVLRFFLAVRGA